MGSGSPGTGSRFSGSGIEVFGQRSGEFGSHLEDSASLWCWSCGMTHSFRIENQRTLLDSLEILFARLIRRGLHRPELPADTHVPLLVPDRPEALAR